MAYTSERPDTREKLMGVWVGGLLGRQRESGRRADRQVGKAARRMDGRASR